MIGSAQIDQNIRQIKNKATDINAVAFSIANLLLCF